MATIQIDPTGPFTIRWPRTDKDIIALATTWVLYESSRTLASQLKDITLAMVQTKLDLATATHTNAATGEINRAQAGTDYRTALNTVRTNLERALHLLKYKHASNLMKIESWGFKAYQTSRGLTIRMPTKHADLIELLRRYVAYEASIGVAQQITDPTLASMEALLVDIQDLAQNRNSGRVQRSGNIQDRAAVVRELLEYLQAAAFTLTLTQFNGQIHQNLGNWGYTILARTPPATEEGTEPPAG